MENFGGYSARHFDAETGSPRRISPLADFGYWGYRYYSPNLGRWLSRDPMGEDGALNIYLGFRNSPSLFHDALGKEDEPADSGISACCMYQKTHIVSSPTSGSTVGHVSIHCYKNVSCSKEGDPAACCECCKPASFRGSLIVGLVGAYRGQCCFCTVRVTRAPWSSVVPHHEFEISCPSSQWGPAYTKSLDRWPDNNICGGATIRPSDSPSNLPITASTKQIPCETGQRLKARIEAAYRGYTRDWDCILIHRDCRSFAYWWYNAAGPGYEECQP